MNILDYIKDKFGLIKNFLILVVVALVVWSYLYPEDANKKYCFIGMEADEIERGTFAIFEYRYVDNKNQKDYDIDPSTSYIITPDNKKIFQKDKISIAMFPDSFPSSDSNIVGEYQIYFENAELNKNSRDKEPCSAVKKFRVKDGKVIIRPTIADYEKNAYVKVLPDMIQKGERVKLSYGYNDLTNNEHLTSAITTVTVETPKEKIFTSNFAKVFPDDFIGADTLEAGVYYVSVMRKIITTQGNEDILFSASNIFIVE